MRIIILIGLIISSNLALGQDPSFMEFIKSKTIIDTTELINDQISVTLLTAKNKPDSNGAMVWIVSDNAIDEPKFLGYIESTYGFYFPDHQPISEHIVLARVSEYNGTILLISTTKMIEIPGYYYCVLDNFIYTKAAGDGDNLVGCYNIQTGKLKTKVWNNINGYDPWGINNKYNYGDIVWLNMP